MSDLTEHMVERMRVEIAQSAAADLLAALKRLPDGPLRSEATQKVEDVRHLVAASTSEHGAPPDTAGWIVRVKTIDGGIQVVVHGNRPAIEARDRALDVLFDRGRIPSITNVVTETKQMRAGDVLEYTGDEPVIQL